jgi:hypothetical protein
VRPLTVRSWSKSKTELPLLRNTGEGREGKSPSASANTNTSCSVLPLPLPVPLLRKSTYHHPVSRMKRQHASTGAGEEGRWVYKGCAVFVDLEVVVSVPYKFGKERWVEVLSPEGSFVLYAGMCARCVCYMLCGADVCDETQKRSRTRGQRRSSR